MQIEKISLEERLERLRDGLCAHQEYYAVEIYRFANLPITTYLGNNEEELRQLASHMNISCDELRTMTYKQVARDINDKIYNCGDTFWCSAGEVLVLPLMRAYNCQTANTEKDAVLQKQNKPRRIPLDERLKDSFALEDLAFPGMDVASFMLFMDELVDSGGWGRFELDYQSNLQQFGDHTIASLAAASAQMTEKQREDFYYHLLIKPFGWLDEYPREKYIPR